MKRLGIALLLLVVLVGAYFLLRHYAQPQAFVAPSSFHTASWNGDNLDSIAFAFSDQQTVTLTKENGSWKVNGFEADADRMQQLLDAFSKASVSSRVSTNPNNHDHFEVDDAKGVTMTLSSNGQEVQKLIIGKSAGGNNLYVRLPDDDAVYVLSNIPRYLVSEELAIWRDRHVFAMKKEEVRLVSYKTPTETWILKKTGDATWQLQRNQQASADVDVDKVNNWLSGVVGLQASDFPDASQDPLPPLSTITIETGTLDALSSSADYQIGQTNTDGQLFIRTENQPDLIVAKDSFDSTFTAYTKLSETLALSGDQAQP